MDDVRFGEVQLQVRMGDIASQPDVDAVVNAANAQLRPGGGVAGAIHAAAGPDLAQECEPLAPIAPGQCVITAGHGLPNPHVLHCLGPVYGHDEPSDELLRDCYRNALGVAEEHRLASVAFPAISTGAFGYPAREAAEIALATIASVAPTLRHVRLVRFVLFGERDTHAFRHALAHLPAG